jgi:predicted nucleic acid-binding protein
VKVIDTDILIDHFHGIHAATDYITNALLADGELFISIVSVAEMLAGMRPEEKTATEELLALFTIQPADELIARIAGTYLHEFAKSNNLELGDSLIAGTARRLNAELVTRNVKHYPMKDIIVNVPYEHISKKK